MKRSRRRSYSPTYLTPSPSPRELSPQPSAHPSFIRDGCDDGAVAMSALSRPPSMATLPPTLREILSNAAPPPWTLSAFMAYLSQNHCLETLEFTMEAERYRAAYADILGHLHEQQAASWLRDANDHVCSLWQKMMNAYIQPCGPREVNLPGPVRDHLLSLACFPAPPDPSELDAAVRIVYELMNDSVLLPFLESVSGAHATAVGFERDEVELDSRQGRARLRIPRDASSSSSPQEESSRSPKLPRLPQLPQLSLGRRADGAARSSSSSSTDAAEQEPEALTDDSSGSTPPPPGDPLTPPTTPPTSDWGFSTSPGSLQRAISAHNNGWKRMSAKLGLSKKSRSARRGNHGSNSNTSGGPSSSSSSSSSAAVAAAGSGSTGTDADVPMGEANYYPGGSNEYHPRNHSHHNNPL